MAGRGQHGKGDKQQTAGTPLSRKGWLCPFHCWWVSPVWLVWCPRPWGHSQQLCHAATHYMGPQVPAGQVCKDMGKGRVPVCMLMRATELAKMACQGDSATAEQHPLVLLQLLTSICCPSTCRSQRGGSDQL